MKFLKKSPQRGRRMVYGRVESAYLVKREGETCYRRIYEDWTQLEQNGSTNPKKWSPVPLVIMVKGEKIAFDRNDLPKEN